MAFKVLCNLASSFLCEPLTPLPTTPNLLLLFDQAKLFPAPSGTCARAVPLLRSIFPVGNAVLCFSYTSERPSLATQSEVALSTNPVTPVTLAHFISFV